MALSSTSIEAAGRPTEVLKTGSGEPLVYLHGGGIIEGFDFLETLSNHFEVFALLRPGYGNTDPEPPLNGADAVAAHVRDVLDALHIDRAVVVGHSLGGWVASKFAAQFPERVRELVLGAPLGMEVPGEPIANMMVLSPPERLATLSNDPRVWDGRLPAGPDPEFQAAREREQQALRGYAPMPSDPALEGTTERLVMPTQLLWGEGDRLIPVAHAAAWQKAIPHASLQTLPGAGHLLFAERPSQTLGSIPVFVDAARR